MKIKHLLFILLLGLFFVACGDDEEEMMETCETTDITYTNTVAAIFNNSCAVSGCHVNGNEAFAFFSLEGYANSKAVADFGRIVGAISHSAGFSPMPRGGAQLDQCSIDKIAAWVNAGAPE